MLNQTVITGNLGDNPKEFFSPEGVPVTSFDLAFDSQEKDLLDKNSHNSTNWRKYVPNISIKAHA